MDASTFWHILGALLAFGMGMGCGSYATMPYYRLPNGLLSMGRGRWGGKRSYCPSCKVKLRTRDLVPVFNRLWHRGKCYNCGAEISWVYWLIEFSAAVTSVLLYFKLGFSEEFLVFYGVMLSLIILSATEYTYRKLPYQMFIVILLFGFLRMPLERVFDQIHVFFFGVLLCLAFVKLHDKFSDVAFKRYDLLQLLCVAAVWMDWLTFAVFIGLIGIFSSFFFLLFRHNTLRYGLIITTLWALHLIYL